MSCVIYSGDTRVFAELGHLKMCACPCVSTPNTDKLNMTASHGQHLGQLVILTSEVVEFLKHR